MKEKSIWLNINILSQHMHHGLMKQAVLIINDPEPHKSHSYIYIGIALQYVRDDFY